MTKGVLSLTRCEETESVLDMHFGFKLLMSASSEEEGNLPTKEVHLPFGRFSYQTIKTKTIEPQKAHSYSM
jgi:hypothetical protein